MRNRLAHFKDTFREVIIGPETLDKPEKILDFLNEIPDLELTQELQSPKIVEHAQTIELAVQWLESVVGDEAYAAA